MNRRAFLQCGALAATGITLADCLRLKALARPGSRDRRADTSVILLWMDGGPSHHDTFDPKPDAPAEIRGEFKPIATAVPGIQICEHLPRTARLMDRLALIRSLHHSDNLHEGAIHWVQTGHGYPGAFDPVNMRHPRDPAAGAVAARQLGPAEPGLPAYVKVFKDGGYDHSYQGAAYLGRIYNPLEIGSDIRRTAFRESDPLNPAHLAAPVLTLPKEITSDRLSDRQTLLKHLDQWHRRLEQSGTLDTVDRFRRQAYQLLFSGRVRKAFDLTDEPIQCRDRYGQHLWGQGTLLARRLVEAGVRFVTVNLHGDPPLPSDQFSWDTHVDHFPAMKNHLLPVFDQLFSALIEDLWQRGLNERVIVMAIGEFGRTPRIFSDGRPGGPGRGHWAQAFSAVVAGGGIRGGQVVGSTDAKGEAPRDRPVTPQDLLATLYANLGIDPHASVSDSEGRPLPILPNAKVIPELQAR